MEYVFFYTSMAVLFIIVLFALYSRKFLLPNIIIGLSSIGYSLISDNIFGSILKLFFYISPEKSTLYMIVAGICIYPLLNILYTMFLPKSGVLVYTILWIVGMLIFEYLSLMTKTIVFTGWKMFPWSVALYAVTYLWIYYLYMFLVNKIPANESNS